MKHEINDDYYTSIQNVKRVAHVSHDVTWWLVEYADGTLIQVRDSEFAVVRGDLDDAEADEVYRWIDDDDVNQALFEIGYGPSADVARSDALFDELYDIAHQLPQGIRGVELAQHYCATGREHHKVYTELYGDNAAKQYRQAYKLTV